MLIRCPGLQSYIKRSIDISKSLNLVKRHKGFAASMAEALERLEEEEVLHKAEKSAEENAVKAAKLLKQNLKKRKWVEWKDDEPAEAAKQRPPFDPATRVKRKKTAILLGYSGVNYFGMQRNPGMPTIEEELFKAMLKHKWITEDAFEQSQNACFQRAARTDKGVSAARQVCSIKLPEELDIKALNEDLPEQIRLFAAQRVTKGFNSKAQCNARTYTYTLPTIAFAKCTELHDFESYRIDVTRLEKVNEVLKLYEGTKNYHNFTSKKNFFDPSAKRYMMSFTSSEPFLTSKGVEYVTLKVKGQSFMLHQIRKMVALVIAIVRDNTTIATLERAFTEDRIDLPMAPGLGLVLDTVHYERYNGRYGNDGIHAPLTWEQQDAEIKEFIDKYINANIFDTEYKDRPILEWLATLDFHSYDVRRDEIDEEKDKNNTNAADDDNEE